MSKPTIAIRADANENIGSGHIMRSVILASALKDQGYHVIFMVRELLVPLKKKILESGHSIMKIYSDDEIIIYLKNIKSASMLIIDSDDEVYYSESFQQEVRNLGCKLMFVTFFNNYHYHADLILNQNIMAVNQTYSTEGYTKLLLGPKYLIMDKGFDDLSKNNILSFEQKKNVFLVTFGYANPGERMRMTLSALSELEVKPDKIILVTKSELLEEFEDFRIEGVKMEGYSFTDRMPELMSEAKYGINSGGLTVWELASMNALNIIIADSKREILSSEFLSNSKYAYYLGTTRDLNTKRLLRELNEIMHNNKKNKQIAENLSSKINTRGSELVAKEINSTING